MNVMLYYSAERKPRPMLDAVRDRMLRQAARMEWGTVGVTVNPSTLFTVNVLRLPGAVPGAIFDAITAGLREIPDDVTVWLVEDDCIYHDLHFELAPLCPETTFNYDLNMVHLTPRGFFSRHNRGSIALSHAWARADVLKDAMRRKLAEIKAGTFTCYEPAGSLGYATAHTSAPYASIDIRHSNNTTWKVDPSQVYDQTEPGWPDAASMVRDYAIV